MFDADREGREQFLRRDSHWSSAGIDVGARALSDLLGAQPAVAGAPPHVFQRRNIRSAYTNDLVKVLNLPAQRAEQFGLHETHIVTQVLEETGEHWRSDPSSSILFIGDSFLGHFSTGEGATLAGGLAEQVSYYLQRTVDREENHLTAGPFGARELLGS